MSTTLLFHMDEKFLQAYAEYLRTLKEAEPQKTFVLEFSINVVPDGIGVEASDPQVSVIGKDEE